MAYITGENKLGFFKNLFFTYQTIGIHVFGSSTLIASHMYTHLVHEPLLNTTCISK